MCTKLKESLIILWKIIKDEVRKKKSVNNKSVNNKSACKFDGSCYNSTVIFFRPVGQEVKTPPSQGGITGSIPVRAVSESLMNGRFFFWLIRNSYATDIN